MPIYTRKGDTGETSLGDGRRTLKTDIRIEAIGAVDELNAGLGFALTLLPLTSDVRRSLAPIQDHLFALGARLALPTDAEDKYRDRIPDLPADTIERFEQTIDRWWNQMPELKEFILPGGTPAGAALHIARTLARRAERMTIRLRQTEPTVDPALIKYLNRLSDLLFAAARFANHEQAIADRHWDKNLS